MNINTFEQERIKYRPSLPPLLTQLVNIEAKPGKSLEAPAPIQALFPYTQHQPMVEFTLRHDRMDPLLKVGVVLSGGQAPGGHNVIIGLYEALKKLNANSRLFGFLDGPMGIIEKRFRELNQEILAPFYNTGGFDLIGSGRTKIETSEQFEKVLKHCNNLQLDGLVVIGGDDSNTNAALLAEYFIAHGSSTCVVGVPKTIDGDLKNKFIESSFGFDTACKVYSEMIGNICRDAKSANKYTHFIKLMGRSASHIALECALQTHPNLLFIGEEVAKKKITLKHITQEISQLIVQRGALGQHHSVILIPEGLIEFIPEIKALIEELNRLVGQEKEQILSKLSKGAQATFAYLPEKIGQQLLLDRDPHGNIQVSHIATEQLLIEMVQKELKNSKDFKGTFNPIGHFFGYEGRSAYPSNFDATYCYALGFTAVALIASKLSGYMSVLQHLDRGVEHWMPAGIPLTAMMDMEERGGKRKAVIKKALVDLESEPFTLLERHRKTWTLEDHYRFPGPIQFFGPSTLSDALTFTLNSKPRTSPDFEI